MTEITVAKLKAFATGIKPERAAIYAPALNAIIDMVALNSRLRRAHFMAQLAHESAGFSALIESTDYKDPVRLDQMFGNVKGVAHAKTLIKAGPVAIANCIYANRLGNGDEQSGDGYRYRGRGFIMVTGKSNYAAAEASSHLPLLAHPELLGKATYAAQASAFFWKSHNLNLSADADDVVAVTRVVNGPALAGLENRRMWLERAKTFFG